MIPTKRVIFITTLFLFLIVFLFFSPLGKLIVQKKNSGRNLRYQSLTKKQDPFKGDSDFLTTYPFQAGEKLQYGIYSTVVKVGSATITYRGRKTLDNRSVDVVVVEASAPGFHDIETIYGHIDSFAPVRVERTIKLFGEDMEILEEYDLEKNEVTITRRGKKVSVSTLKSEKTLSNVILLLYYLRYNQKKLMIGDTLEFNLPTKELQMVIDKEMKLKVPMGAYNSLYIRSIPPKFKVWLKANDNFIPLRLQGAIGFGNTHLELIDIESPS